MIIDNQYKPKFPNIQNYTKQIFSNKKIITSFLKRKINTKNSRSK